MEMKYSKGWIYLSYLICALKLLFTFAFFSGQISFFFMFFTIMSIPVYLAMMLYEEIALLCLIGLAVTLLLWFLAFVFSVFGIKNKKARTISAFLLTTCAILDFIASMISPNWGVKILGGIVSLIVVAFCVKAILALKERF